MPNIEATLTDPKGIVSRLSGTITFPTTGTAPVTGIALAENDASRWKYYGQTVPPGFMVTMLFGEWYLKDSSNPTPGFKGIPMIGGVGSRFLVPAGYHLYSVGAALAFGFQP